MITKSLEAWEAKDEPSRGFLITAFEETTSRIAREIEAS